MPMELFVPITKVDVEKREVWGRAVQEEPDKAGEVFDYESSKPLFQAWSAEFEKATDGKSLGNIRAMHGKVAAGKITALDCNDADKAIDIGTKIVDDGEWQKCVEGVYTGFSIGGSYAKRWKNGALVRYTAKPSEISLVDNPCVPSARFTMVKADGSTEERTFTVSVTADATETADEATKADAPAAANDTPADPPIDDTTEKVAARSDASPKEGERTYGDVAFADAKNKKYPIDTAEHIRAAWNYINKPKNADKYSAADVKAIKAKIIAAWKDKIDSKGPPAAQKAETIEALSKSLYSVSDFAMAINTLAGVAQCAEFEAAYEQDGSEVPAKLRAWLAEGAALLIAMADEETKEMLAALEPTNAPAMALATPDGDLAKADAADTLQKLIERTAQLEQVEDERDGERAQLTKLAADVATLTAERDQLTKRVAELEAEPAPAKGVLKTVVVDKADDNGGAPAAEDEPALDPTDPDYAAKAALAEMKKALRTPQLMKR